MGCVYVCLALLAQITAALASKAYVVYMGGAGAGAAADPLLILTALHGGSSELAQASHLYTFRHAFSGFAAKLTIHQASLISRMPGVISVFPNSRRSLHTTHSWDFMGLFPQESMEIPGFSTANQHNLIIGFIDTGIWPESPSFSDLNMPPVPSTWEGQCQQGEAFNASSCNRKVIGARYYLSGFEAEQDSSKTIKFRSPRDSSGHGSHTASIAAGRYVPNMNFNGLGGGGARGGAPLARIVAYKACWDSGCYDVDLLAAFDDAIRDGVHILSISLGPDAPQGDYFNDAISIGSFHAVTRGIVVVSSVGNQGNQGSATNVAPWMITVSASSTDRDFRSQIILGEGTTTYMGESLTKEEISTSANIISASEAFSGYFTPYQSSYCLESSLDKTKARGKVLVCQHAEASLESKLAKSVVVKKAGGVGMVLIDEEDKDVAIPFVIPAAIVGTHTGDRILSYVNSSRKPNARILSAKTVLGSRPAPRVASFSSRGPNALTPEILKPDVTAPGLNILAAWSPAHANIHFNILSGTSMACPHATGIVALIKAVHPSWSPSAIKSAIMTTATVLDKKWKHITVDPSGRRGNPFDFGAGFLNPTRVLNPGLIYDAHPQDYKAFLCSVGYDEKLLRLLTGDNSTCTQTYRSAADLNYPSITVPNLRDSYSVTRTLTNVGRPRSTYKAFWSPPVGINITVSPKIVMFNKYGEKVNFTVIFRVIAPSKGYVFGSLTWRRGKLRVTSPLVARVVSFDSGLLR